MKKVTLNAMLGILLLAFAASGSATDVKKSALSVSGEVKTTLPVSSDQTLNRIVNDYVQSPAYKAARVKPTALCASDGSLWACTPENALKGQSMINVDGAMVRNTLDFGRLDPGRLDSSPGCDCVREDDDSPWVCTPPGCMGTFAGSRIDPRQNDRVTTPRRGDQVTPRPE